MIELQYQIEELYNRNLLIPRMNAWFDSLELLPEDHPMYSLVRKACVQLGIQKRIKTEAMVGMLSVGDTSIADAAAFLESLVSSGYAHYDPTRKEFIVAYEPDSQLQTEIATFQFPPPMVVQPEDVTDNWHCGYVMAKETVMTLGSETNQDVCLDVMNIMNSFEFTLNEDILKFDNKHKSFHQKSEKETEADFRKRQQQWLKFDKHTRFLVDEIYSGKHLWFTHKFDGRGRMYNKGYHLNYQGGPWHKALIQLIPIKLEAE